MAKTDIPGIPSSEITPEHVYVNRRQFMLGLGGLAAAAALAACAAPSNPAPAATTVPAVVATGATVDELGDPLTTYEAVTTYNNYYEFGTDKSDPAMRCQKLSHNAVDRGRWAGW